MRVAYLLASFPNTSETFIINEISEAEHQGVVVRVYSQFRPQADCPHETARAMMDRVIYFSPAENASLTSLIFLHLWFLFLYHRHYLSSFLFAIRHRENAMLWTFKVVALYVRQIRKHRPDLLHTHFAYGSCRLTMMAARMMGIPYTFTIHGWGDLYNSPPPDLGLILMNSKQTITVCDFNRKYIIDTYGVPEEKIVVIRCGIAPDFFKPVDHDDRTRGLIVSVGRLHYHKAFHVLIDACRLLADRGVPFICRIIGDGELRKELEAQIERLRLSSSVQLTGAMSNEEVRSNMLVAEIFAMSSAVETVGLAAVEALASELPVVATGIFGVPEMIRAGETGYLCETGNPECIAEYLEKLLSREDLRMSMGKKGRALVMQEHNLPVQVAKLKAVWST
jgi:colanic acid/amylovoran biosynthesis glycosyltransferase